MTTWSYNPIELRAIEEAVAEQHESLIELLNVRLRRNTYMYSGSCPIHQGRNSTAFNYYFEGHSRKGNWLCWTKGCQKTFRDTSIGFARGIWSSRECGWTQPGDKLFDFVTTVHRLCKHFQINPKEVKLRALDLEKRRAVYQSNFFRKSNPIHNIWLPSSEVVKHLNIPSQYFLNRGISEKTLREFIVGDYKYETGEMARRAVIPILDHMEPNMVVGFTGRSWYCQCSKCKLWHDIDSSCPNSDNCRLFSKWWNDSRFAKAHYLFNHHNIKDKSEIRLVEGPKDVLELVDKGCDNAVAIFGTNLCDPQLSKLISSGVTKIIISLDNDDAGRLATQDLERRLSRSFKVEVDLI